MLETTLNFFSTKVLYYTETTKRKKDKMTKTKNMCKESVIANINGLSVGDRAHCGPYGIITCTKSATTVKGVTPVCKRGARRFKVANSSYLRNGGNWTMSALRKAICG